MPIHDARVSIRERGQIGVRTAQDYSDALVLLGPVGARGESGVGSCGTCFDGDAEVPPQQSPRLENVLILDEDANGRRSLCYLEGRSADAPGSERICGHS